MTDPFPAVPPPVSPANNVPYVITVALGIMTGVAGVVAITFARPTQDNSVLITTMLGFIVTSTTSLLAFMKAQETHLSVNGRLDAFMHNSAQAARARGFDEGRQQGQNEANARTDALTADSHSVRGLPPPT